MAQINPRLLDRLVDKLGITKAHVYKKIENVARRTFLARKLAALVLATEHGINISKYSTEDERAEIRASMNGLAKALPLRVVSESAQKDRGQRSNRKARPPKARDNSVFVVHGRDDALRRAMFSLLRDIGLTPIEWSKAVLLPKKGGGNPQIADILDTAMDQVQAVLVLLSPDDLARLRPELLKSREKRTEGKLQGQPRANVIFEAGLALGRHPDKTILVQVGDVRGFSDIAGKHMVHLSDEVPKKKDLANRLAKVGCKVDLVGDDWTKPHGFVPQS